VDQKTQPDVVKLHTDLEV